MEQVEEIRHTIGMKERYKQRKETIEWCGIKKVDSLFSRIS